MRNIYSLFFILVFFLILIKELLPILIISAVIGVFVFIISTIIKENKAKKLEIINKEREKIRQEHQKRKEEKQHKIQNIHEKCKRFEGLLNNEGLAKQEKTLKSILSVAPRSGYDKPFLDIKIRRNQLKYDIGKCALSCIDAVNQDKLTEDMLTNLDSLIAEYDNIKTATDGFVVSVIKKKEFGTLISLIEEVRDNSYTMLATDPNLSNLNLCSGPFRYYSFNNDSFLNVHSCERNIHLKSRNISLYLYPLYIIEATNNENFTIHQWSGLTFETRTIRAFIKGYNSHIKGAIELCHQYEHTCVDGSPDRRYKNNDIYRMYNVCVIKCNQIPNFNFIVADKTYANRLVQYFNSYATLKQPMRNADSKKASDPDKSNLAYLLTELDNTISEYGVDIVNSKKLFYIISDSGCFKNDAKLRLLFRELVNDHLLERFLIFHMKQPEIETLALLYSYKFSYPVEECMSFINGVSYVLSKYRVA